MSNEKPQNFRQGDCYNRSNLKSINPIGKNVNIVSIFKIECAIEIG